MTHRSHNFYITYCKSHKHLGSELAEDRYSCLSTLDAVSNVEDTPEAWAERRIRTALALAGLYVVKQNFVAAVQILQKDPHFWCCSMC